MDAPIRLRSRLHGAIVGLAIAVLVGGLGVAPVAIAEAAAESARPESAGGSREAGSRTEKAPPVLIGPSRVTLRGGKTIDGIAVIRDRSGVRVVLEDGSEIRLDPERVVSVVALADLERPSAPPSSRASAPGSAGPVRGRAETKNTKAVAAKGKTRSAGATGRAPAPADRRSSGSKASRTAEDSRLEDARVAEDLERLAAMLEAAREAAETTHVAEDEEGGAAADRLGSTISSDPGAGPNGERREKGLVRVTPKPEELDATRPVSKPGFRFVGLKGKLPKYASTPEPLPDFPKPSEPTTSFGASTWRPTQGFRSSVRWSQKLPPATSFSNALSGLPRPITGLGPSWWTPPPVKWPSSIFPETWQPTDGFSSDRKAAGEEKPK